MMKGRLSMKKSLVSLLVCLGIVLSLVYAQTESVFKQEKLSDSLYFFVDKTPSPVSLLVSAGDDGILLVDTVAAANAEALKKEIQAFGKGNPKIIISSHGHNEHFEGNIAFGADPIIIAHKILRTQITTGTNVFQDYPSYILADIEIDASPLTLYFNGDEIRIIPLPGGHDDSDIAIWFTKSKVIYAGGLVMFGKSLPWVNPTCSAITLLDNVKKLIDMLPDDTTVVGGHGVKTTMADYKQSYKGIADLHEMILSAYKSGKKSDEIKNDPQIKNYASYETPWTKLNDYIDRVIKDYEIASGKITPPAVQKDAYKPLYEAYKKGGIKEMTKAFIPFKKDPEFSDANREEILFNITYLIKSKGKVAECAEMSELFLKEFPKSQYAFYAYYWIGKNEIQQGDKKKALKTMKKALELSPNHPAILAAIKELEGK